MKLPWIDVEHMSDCGMNEKPTLLPLQESDAFSRTQLRRGITILISPTGKVNEKHWEFIFGRFLLPISSDPIVSMLDSLPYLGLFFAL